jgi:hypothetical protein
MIKKNTKIIFKDSEGQDKELIGGLPLTKNEIVHVTKQGEKINYIVEDKIVNISLDGEDQIADIVYVLKKQ